MAFLRVPVWTPVQLYCIQRAGYQKFEFLKTHHRSSSNKQSREGLIYNRTWPVYERHRLYLGRIIVVPRRLAVCSWSDKGDAPATSRGMKSRITKWKDKCDPGALS